ncbi:alpha-galactosidase [Treponema bryantii]|uniref:Alpha-galactosidase n=1 Tax=Treponema bryantii TaxID=163 RepID=A0A1I3JJ99_9SPIR|nr:alpha-galactosidase [Treponema bryantii]SFI60349.1 alpha-galactosidase [Treponema bryantii]
MISFNSKTNSFRLDTPNSTYSIFINERGYIGHAYYGSKIGDDDVSYLTRNKEYGFSDNKIFREKGSFLDFFPQELPTEGLGDFRESALAVCDSEGHNAIELKYKSHKITGGAKALPGLPAVFGGAEDCSVLELTATDDILGAEVTLVYTVFEKLDAIVRSVRIKNNGAKPLYIKKALSLALDLDNDNYDMITLHGSWARERHMERHPVHMGKQGVVSIRGETSHQEHPFVALLDHNADWDSGKVYGMNFIYSGNFVADVQKNQFENIRAVMGINPEGFTWKLENGDVFDTPQAVLVYSDSGLNGMSRTFHDLYREHLIRSPYKKTDRPILINNWEATYFNFDTDKLIDIAREASKDGIEMLVMDDGWFGHRSFDDSSLGDWIVNEEKIKGGLKHLVDEVNKLGMKFGIWFEPEMISPDSDLYRAHPDWAIQIPGREPGMSRAQLVLDITRKEVEDYTYESLAKILRSANIEYVKWDMNRQLTDIGSVNLPADRIGEFYHRYVLAVYRLQERLLTEFPKLLLENCSGGGARFDPGMFFYSPQIWCSDDTDAIERLAIQEGTALIYPLSTMGAHVSVCPNHACGRVTPFKTRGYVALSGTFGYELDITKLPPEERAMIPGQVALYKKFSSLIRNGDYSRIASYRENNEYDCWASISKDKTKALVTFVQVLNHPNYKTRFLKINGLKPESKYRITWPDEKAEDFPAMELFGRTLANAGLPIRRDWGDFRAQLIFIEEI